MFVTTLGVTPLLQEALVLANLFDEDFDINLVTLFFGLSFPRSCIDASRSCLVMKWVFTEVEIFVIKTLGVYNAMK